MECIWYDDMIHNWYDGQLFFLLVFFFAFLRWHNCAGLVHYYYYYYMKGNLSPNTGFINKYTINQGIGGGLFSIS